MFYYLRSILRYHHIYLGRNARRFTIHSQHSPNNRVGCSAWQISPNNGHSGQRIQCTRIFRLVSDFDHAERSILRPSEPQAWYSSGVSP